MRKTSPPTKQPLFVLAGAPGAGKSTVARALLQHFEPGLHVPVDHFLQSIVPKATGYGAENDDEAEQRHRLARWSALQTATIFAEAGYAVALEDRVTEQVFQRQYQPLLHGYTIHKILLAPVVDVAFARCRAAGNPFPEEAVRQIHTELLRSNRPAVNWLVVDTSELSVEATVDSILAAVPGPTS